MADTQQGAVITNLNFISWQKDRSSRLSIITSTSWHSLVLIWIAWTTFPKMRTYLVVGKSSLHLRTKEKTGNRYNWRNYLWKQNLCINIICLKTKVSKVTQAEIFKIELFTIDVMHIE